MRSFLIIISAIIMFSACENSPEKANNKTIPKTGCDSPSPTNTAADSQKIIIDSRMTFEEAVSGTSAPRNVIEQLILIDVEYYSFDKRLHRGQLVVNKSIEKDIAEVFELIKEIRFPIKQVIPIIAYNWDDDLSMAANNTSSFCYRQVAGTGQLSRHATGKAIDINPFLNPLIWKLPHESNLTVPEGAVYDKNKVGTLYAGHPVVEAFQNRKFIWGYYFPKYYDIHHFHKD